MDRAQIGTRIQKQRGQFGFTREAFAEKLGITTKFCADIELGNKGMSVQTLCNISSILKLSTDYILFGTTQENQDFPSMFHQHCTSAERKCSVDILKTYLLAWSVSENNW